MTTTPTESGPSGGRFLVTAICVFGGVVVAAVHVDIGVALVLAVVGLYLLVRFSAKLGWKLDDAKPCTTSEARARQRLLVRMVVLACVHGIVMGIWSCGLSGAVTGLYFGSITGIVFFFPRAAFRIVAQTRPIPIGFLNFLADGTCGYCVYGASAVPMDAPVVAIMFATLPLFLLFFRMVADPRLIVDGVRAGGRQLDEN